MYQFPCLVVGPILDVEEGRADTRRESWRNTNNREAITVSNLEAQRASIEGAIEGGTICSALESTASRLPDHPALMARDSAGAWQTTTYAQYREKIRDVALGLRALGFEPGQFGAVLCRNRPEHVIIDQAIVHAQGTPVSLYNTLAPDQIQYIVAHCEARIAFVEDAAFLEKFMKVRAELPLLERVVLIEPSEDAASDWVITLDEVIEAGRAAHAKDPTAFDAMWKQVKPDDLLTLIYTSGTTGPPKAVMNFHRNVLWDIESMSRVNPPDPDGRIVSYLPLAHVADRFLTMYSGAVHGFTIYYCPELAMMLPVLLEVRPTYFGAVPRVWEKLHAGINAAIGAEADEAKRAMALKAIEVGRAVSAYRDKGEAPPQELAEAFAALAPVREAIRAKVGLDQVRTTITGAAPTPLEVLEFFDAIGITIAEVWGMSELSAVATINPLDAVRLGTIGKPLEGVELSIAEDGELLVRGGLLMGGYYKDPEKTAETIDEDGWLHTGDVATVDAAGYYRIVDRKKELIITAGGKNISPANLEGALKEHPLIGQVCVIGDNRPYLSALIVLDHELAPIWAMRNGVDSSGGVAALVVDPRVQAEIEHAVAALNEKVSRVENIRRFTVLAAEWTAESEELTPTMKLKRRVINDKYADEIAALYS